MSADRLAPILARRRADVAESKRATTLHDLERRLASAPPVRGFDAALARPGLQVIAELKRRSPSAGDLRPDAEPGAIAPAYARAGAAALSVLTEPHFFSGSLGDMVAARGACKIPVLRKDFIVDPWQIAEARVAGADAVLLIVAALGRETEAYLRVTRDYGVDALVEVHTEAELDIALVAGARIIGVNNRDLTSFVIDLAVSERLARRMPPDRLLVAESGIETVEHIRRMRDTGAAAVLIGSALMTSPDPGSRLADLIAGVRL